MTEYTIGVVAHLDRVEMAHNLSEDVGARLVNVDDGELGCSGNHGFVQARLVAERGWSVVLEDDAVPCNGFDDDLLTVLEIVGSGSLGEDVGIVSLYLGTGYPQNYQRRVIDAVAADTSFILCPRLLHAVGYAIAPDIKGGLATWMARNKRGPGMAPDEAMSVWAARHGIRVAYTNPSLVDHRDTATVIRARSNTFAPGRNRVRKAHNTAQRLTWTDNSVTM